jgi:CrcB protein
MKLFVLVGIGGALGSMLRYAIAGLLNSPSPAQGLPLGTLFVNLLGCFFIGLLATMLTGDDLWTGQAYAFLVIGILGGFTTFSSFGLEAQSLMVAGRWSSAALYVTLSNLGGLVAAYFGYALADLL